MAACCCRMTTKPACDRLTHDDDRGGCRCAPASDLHGNEHRRQLLLPTEQHARRYPVATRDLREPRTRLCHLLKDPSFVRFAELPPMALAWRRNDGA